MPPKKTKAAKARNQRANQLEEESVPSTPTVETPTGSSFFGNAQDAAKGPQTPVETNGSNNPLGAQVNGSPANGATNGKFREELGDSEPEAQRSPPVPKPSAPEPARTSLFNRLNRVVGSAVSAVSAVGDTVQALSADAAPPTDSPKSSTILSPPPAKPPLVTSHSRTRTGSTTYHTPTGGSPDQASPPDEPNLASPQSNKPPITLSPPPQKPPTTASPKRARTGSNTSTAPNGRAGSQAPPIDEPSAGSPQTPKPANGVSSPQQKPQVVTSPPLPRATSTTSPIAAKPGDIPLTDMPRPGTPTNKPSGSQAGSGFRRALPATPGKAGQTQGLTPSPIKTTSKDSPRPLPLPAPPTPGVIPPTAAGAAFPNGNAHRSNKPSYDFLLPRPPSPTMTAISGVSHWTQMPPQPEAEEIQEALDSMRDTFDVIKNAFDQMQKTNQKVSQIKHQFDPKKEMDSLRKHMEQNDVKQEKRMDEIKGLLKDVLKDKVLPHVYNEITKSVEATIHDQVDKRVAEQLQIHLSTRLQDEVEEYRKQLEEVSVSLQNAEARRHNAILRSNNMNDALHTLLKPDGTISKHFPRTLTDLFKLEGTVARELITEYGLPDVGESRERNLNRFMQYCGVAYQMVPTAALI